LEASEVILDCFRSNWTVLEQFKDHIEGSGLLQKQLEILEGFKEYWKLLNCSRIAFRQFCNLLKASRLVEEHLEASMLFQEYLEVSRQFLEGFRISIVFWKLLKSF